MEQSWWSRVPQPMHRLERDMPNTRLASKVIKVVGVRSPPKKSGLDFDWFERYFSAEKLEDGHAYLVVALVCGKATIISLSHVVVDSVFEDMCEGDCLNSCLKFIVSPVNLPLPVPLKGPRDAATIGSFFKGACYFSRSQKGQVKCAALAIDTYSVLSLRMTLPKLAFTAGRIIDFHFISYKHKASLTSFRIATNQHLLRQMKALSA